MTSYPATFDVSSPPRFERLQLLLRLLILFLLALLGLRTGWIAMLVYVALPLVAALAIQSTGVTVYLERTAPSIVRVIRWLLSFQAYMLFVVDRFPTGDETLVDFAVTTSGTPTPGGAVMRLLSSLPEALVLMILGCFGCIVSLLSGLAVLFTERVPRSFRSFQIGWLRWQARLLAYHASIVDVAPPYELTGQSGPTAATPR